MELNDINIKVSIIVPCYQVEKYLRDCINSLIHQTLKEIEIILVNDGSTDSTPEICDEYARLDRRIRVIHKQNAGPGMARNSGLEIARGEYIVFIDSDDLLNHNTLALFYDLAQKNNLDYAGYTYEKFVGASDTCDLSSAISVFEPRLLKGDEIRDLRLNIIAGDSHCPVDFPEFQSSCIGLYRYSLIIQHDIRFHSERELVSEDSVFNLDFFKYATNIILTKTVAYFYRFNPLSLTHQISTAKLEKHLFFYDFLETYCKLDPQLNGEGIQRSKRRLMGAYRSTMFNLAIDILPFKERYAKIVDLMNKPIWLIVYESYNWQTLPLKYIISFLLCKFKMPFLFILCSKLIYKNRW